MQEEQPNDTVAAADLDRGFPIVGIGASAGGLAAIEALLSEVPDDAGLALVFIQHLAPDRHSLLVDLITRCTSMPVQEVIDGVRVVPNNIYVIPPDRDLELVGGALRLTPPRSPRGLRLPIDVFFNSLALHEEDRAIAIILSGSGSDGTLGIRAIKGAGGMVMAQEPRSAEYSGMPGSAVASGLVDYVVTPSEVAAQLTAYVEHSFGPADGNGQAVRTSGDAIHQALVLMRQRTGHDFTGYKSNTITRRMNRRMAIQQISESATYVQYIRDHPEESDALFRDLLIGVTNFFRDPDVFSALESEVIPKIAAQVSDGETLRVWVAGCSTGEEAYSVAVLLQEELERGTRPMQVQIFATDIDRLAIERARAGVYPATITADVSASRLQRFFVWDESANNYRVSKTIRDLIVFSEQNLVSDPPFSQLDLVVCRNVLIYLGPVLQEKLISVFHYGLRPRGILLLGTSETVGESKTLFAAIDRSNKVFRKDDRGRGPHRFQMTGTNSHAPRRVRRPVAAQRAVSFRRLAEETLLHRYAHVGILVNARGDIFYIHGRSGNYLEPSSGSATMNILSMAREGLRRDLSTALHRALSSDEPVTRENVRVKTNGHHVSVNLTVTPVASNGEVPTIEGTFLVTIEPVQEVAAAPIRDAKATQQSDVRVSELERELSTKEDYLQTTLEEMETSSEEMRSTNEELQSVNEEMQSTNEELETSKEEAQSVNEELATVNAELQARVLDLSRATDDMNNLLAGTGVGTVFVDRALKVTRFTPSAVKVINLIHSDVGRPLAHIMSNLAGSVDLIVYIREVLDTLVPQEVEVQTKTGIWFLMNVLPYRTQHNFIEGVVITFVDVTARKQIEMAMREAQAMARGIVAFVSDPLLVLDESLRVVMASTAFYTTFGTSRDTTEKRLLYELGNGQWNVPELRTLLEEILPRDKSFEDFEVNHVFESLGPRKMALSARRFDSGGPSGDLIVLRIQDHRAPPRALALP